MKKIKIIGAILATAIAGSCLVGGTLAYLTSTQKVTNTFTVGNIRLELNETGAVGSADQDKTNSYDRIIPGMEIKKDPTVTIAAKSEDCYVFMNLKDELAIDKNLNINDSWKQIGDTTLYVYTGGAIDAKVVGYAEAATKLPALFESITLGGDTITAEDLEKINNKTITVEAYAHQEEGVTYDIALAAAKAQFNIQ